jgi:SCY1-like protein 2
LQIARALGFLHGQARMVHLNLTPESILINSKARGLIVEFCLR